MSGIVIIGAGQAGASLAEKLRKEGYDGSVTLVGAEQFPPYERPPLSKPYLLGEIPRERLFLRPEAIYAENDISLRLGEAVSVIDGDAQIVTIGGDQVSYDHLAFTTGSEPIRLPASIGGELEGVVTIRSLADIDNISPRFVARRLTTRSVLTRMDAPDRGRPFCQCIAGPSRGSGSGGRAGSFG